jgi:hypothetical protein
MASRRLGILSVVFLVLSCAGPAGRPTQADQTTAIQSSQAFNRAAVIAAAETYADFRWNGTSANAFHGVDEMGNVIDTPDQKFRPQFGWSLEGAVNTGVPYQWGGASSLGAFERGVTSGKLAGHIPTRGQSFWTSEAVGVDCSGLVSNCWRLPGKQSTRSLPKICLQLTSYDQLLPGDILNLRDRHTMIFVSFEAADHQQLNVIEATARQGRVHRSVRDRNDLEGQGYVPLRFRSLVADSTGGL